MDARKILSKLPWRPPFLMIDSLVECKPHQRIVTTKLVTANDSVVAGEGRTPSRFPATLLLEGLGQSAALLFRISRPEDTEATLPMLGFLTASLHGTAAVGESVLSPT